MKRLKLVLSALLLIIVCALAALFVISPETKMGLMTDFVLGRVSKFEFETLMGRDPVREELESKLGPELNETQDAVYAVLKNKAAELSWELESADTTALTATVRLEYTDTDPMVESFISLLSDMLINELCEGTIELKELKTAFENVDDKKLSELITAAGEAEGGDRKSCLCTLSFEKRWGGLVYLPVDVSADAFAALGGELDDETLREKLTAELIRALITEIFDDIRSSDTQTLSKLTGIDLTKTFEIDGYPMLSAAVESFIAAGNSELIYEVGEYDTESKTISVDCTYADASPVLEDFVTSVSLYALKHILTNPIPDDETLALLFTEAAAKQGDFERRTDTLSFVIDIEQSRILIPDGLSSAATAGFASLLASLAKLIYK